MKKRNNASRPPKGWSMWRLLAALAALALIAGACGSSDDDAPAAPEEAPAQEPAASEPADDDAAASEPADDDAAASEPAAEEPAASEPADDDAAASEPADDEAPMADASGVTAAFVLVGPVGDAGWNYAHDQGRQYAEAGTGATTLFVESVPESAEDFRSVAIDFIENEGANVIFGTSFGYMDPMLDLAGEFPDVVFEHASGFKMNDTNFGNYFGRMYQPRYLSGLAAGALTESNNIGYVAAFPIPEVIRGINAFTLGVRAVNPDAEVHVNWTFTWFDPPAEGDAANALLEAGADVIAMHQDSTAAGTAAQDAGARWVAYNSDMSVFAPEAWITAPVWNWGPRYESTINAVADGSYTPGAYWGGMADGIVGLAPLADDVPGDVVDRIESTSEAIIDGSWDVFTGPINDQDGTERVADGETMDDGAMLGMDWFVEGVVGSAAP